MCLFLSVASVLFDRPLSIKRFRELKTPSSSARNLGQYRLNGGCSRFPVHSWIVPESSITSNFLVKQLLSSGTKALDKFTLPSQVLRLHPNSEWLQRSEWPYGTDQQNPPYVDSWTFKRPRVWIEFRKSSEVGSSPSNQDWKIGFCNHWHTMCKSVWVDIYPQCRRWIHWEFQKQLYFLRTYN